MKKYLITPVLVCLFFTIGCGNEFTPNHDHDHDLLHSHNLVLEEEVVSDRTLEEKFELVRVGMTFEEVKFVMGFPYRIKTFYQSNYIEWFYTLDPKDTSGRVFVYKIRFITGNLNHPLNLVFTKRREQTSV
jgi:hypothetical protein